MKLLQTFLFVLAGLLSGYAAWADANDPQVQSLKEQVNLTEQQTQELNKTFKETRAKTDALRKQIQALNKQKRERMNAILTAEQKKKLEEMNNEPPQPLGGEAPQPVSSEPPQPSK